MPQAGPDLLKFHRTEGVRGERRIQPLRATASRYRPLGLVAGQLRIAGFAYKSVIQSVDTPREMIYETTS